MIVKELIIGDLGSYSCDQFYETKLSVKRGEKLQLKSREIPLGGVFSHEIDPRR